MGLAAPLGLLGLLAIPAILAIHLFRRRYRPRPTAGLFLWGSAPLSPAAGRRRQRLVARGSLWFELAAALALTCYLADPYIGDRERADHLIVVLDSRATLQARDDAGRPAADHVRQAVDEAIAELARDDRVTLVTSGLTPRILAGPATSPREARQRLADWRPEAPWHALDDAIGVALDLGRAPGADGADEAAARVLIASDRVPDPLPTGVGVIARGQARPTSGVVDAHWRLADERMGERLFVRVGAAGGVPRSRSLSVVSAAGEHAREIVALDPGQPTSLVIPVPVDAPDTLEVRLAGDDPWPVDDVVRLRRPSRRAVRVHLAFEDAAVGALVARALDAAGGTEPASTMLAADLVLTDAPAAVSDEGRWVLQITPPEEGRIALGPFLAASGHPVVESLDWNGVAWVGGVSVADTGGGLPILMAGDVVLASEIKSPRARRLVLHVDLSRATLTQHPAWPGLVANLVSARRRALPGPARVNLPVGQPTTITAPPDADAVVLQGPDGPPATLPAGDDGLVEVAALERPGTWALTLPKAAGAAPDGVAPWQTINALLIDARLGDLRRATRRDVPAPTPTAGDVERQRGVTAHLLPLLLAVALALLAWWRYRREEAPA